MFERDPLPRQPSPDWPFTPRRVPFYYGWVLALVGTLGVVASIPGQTTGLSVFSGPLREATGLTRLGLANAYLVGTLASGFLLPWGGRLVDRFGARITATCAALALAVAVTLLSYTETLAGWMQQPGRVGGVAPFLLLTTLFWLLRFSGQGMLTLSSRTMIARWFDRHRGLVSAGGGALISFCFSFAPMTLLVWTQRSSWQGAWREIALILVGVAAMALLLYRESPEECGLEIDGLSTTGGSDHVGVPAVPDATRAEALRSWDFWLVTSTVAIQSMIGTAVTFHIVDLAGEAGVEADRFVRLLIPVSMISIVLGFLVGWLVDRVPVRRLLVLMLVSELLMFAAGGYLEARWGRALMVVGWGVAAGCYGPITVAALPRLFGRLHLGAISGVTTMCLVLASALGPSFLALFRDIAGSFHLGLMASAAFPMSGLVVLSVLHLRRRDRAE